MCSRSDAESKKDRWHFAVVVAIVGWIASNYLLQYADYRGKFLDDIRKAHGEFLEAAAAVAMSFEDLERGAGTVESTPHRDPKAELEVAYRKMMAVYWSRYIVFGEPAVEGCIRNLRDVIRDHHDGAATLPAGKSVSSAIIETLLKTGSGMRKYYEHEQSMRLFPLSSVFTHDRYCGA